MKALIVTVGLASSALTLASGTASAFAVDSREDAVTVNLNQSDAAVVSEFHLGGALGPLLPSRSPQGGSRMGSTIDRYAEQTATAGPQAFMWITMHGSLGSHPAGLSVGMYSPAS